MTDFLPFLPANAVFTIPKGDYTQFSIEYRSFVPLRGKEEEGSEANTSPAGEVKD
jgi:hypothetical protein